MGKKKLGVWGGITAFLVGVGVWVGSLFAPPALQKPIQDAAPVIGQQAGELADTLAEEAEKP